MPEPLLPHSEAEIVLVPNPSEKEESAVFEKSENLRSQKLENDGKEQDIKERKNFARKAFLITTIWVVFLFMVIGAEIAFHAFKLEALTEKEFITVVTSTTASIFGFWVLVGRYLFPDNKKK